MPRPKKLNSNGVRVQINLRIDDDFRENLEKVKKLYESRLGISLCYSDIMRMSVKHELDSLSAQFRLRDI